MAAKTFRQIKESILQQYKEDYPDERLYGRVFSLYLLNRYVSLLLKIHERAENRFHESLSRTVK
jgi:hypothetical protein